MPQPEKAALIPIEIIPHPKGIYSVNRGLEKIYRKFQFSSNWSSWGWFPIQICPSFWCWGEFVHPFRPLNFNSSNKTFQENLKTSNKPYGTIPSTKRKPKTRSSVQATKKKQQERRFGWNTKAGIWWCWYLARCPSSYLSRRGKCWGGAFETKLLGRGQSVLDTALEKMLEIWVLVDISGENAGEILDDHFWRVFLKRLSWRFRFRA